MNKNKNYKNQKKYFKFIPQENDILIKDIVVILITIGITALLIINHRQLEDKRNQPEKLVLKPGVGVITEEAVEVENEAESPTISTADWKLYQTQWYGFELKYPKEWNKPVLESAKGEVNWEYRYKFRKPKEDNIYVGFDVVVYDVKKIKELSNTDEFPTVKNEELKEQGVCNKIEGHLGENEEYPAEQIYIGMNDNCYNPAFFYTLTRDDYIYNMVPILAGEEEKTIQPEKEIIDNFPEFISMASTFNLIDIKRPKAVSRPAKSAPMPVWYKKDGAGRFVCDKKNDKPSKSKKNKKKHLDMECCLDPGEYPNPHCYYSSDKYGKLLGK